MKISLFLICLFLFSGCMTINIKEQKEIVSQRAIPKRFVPVETFGWSETGDTKLGMGNGATIYEDTETGIKYLVVYYGSSRTMCRLWEKQPITWSGS